MVKWNISIFMQRCPSCGYCSTDISVASASASNCVKSKSYRKQLNNPEYPELANSYLCLSLIQKKADVLSEAGWSCVDAAWACDDAGSDTAAIKCRKRAVTLLQTARERGQKFGQEPGTEDALLADLLRRSHQFKEALAACDRGLKKMPKGIIMDILRYQRVLIARRDTICHKLTEVGLPGASIVNRLVGEILGGKRKNGVVGVYGKVVKQKTRDGDTVAFVLEDDWGQRVTVLSARNMPITNVRYFIHGRVFLSERGSEYMIREFERIKILSMPQQSQPSGQAPPRKP